jgi:hypothetical protein
MQVCCHFWTLFKYFKFENQERCGIEIPEYSLIFSQMSLGRWF